jgi:hypothetical protein
VVFSPLGSLSFDLGHDVHQAIDEDAVRTVTLGGSNEFAGQGNLAVLHVVQLLLLLALCVLRVHAADDLHEEVLAVCTVGERDALVIFELLNQLLLKFTTSLVVHLLVLGIASRREGAAIGEATRHHHAHDVHIGRILEHLHHDLMGVAVSTTIVRSIATAIRSIDHHTRNLAGRVGIAESIAADRIDDAHALAIAEADESHLGVAGLSEVVDDVAHGKDRLIKRGVAKSKALRVRERDIATANHLREDEKATHGPRKVLVAHVGMVDLNQAERLVDRSSLSRSARGKTTDRIGKCKALVVQIPIHTLNDRTPTSAVLAADEFAVPVLPAVEVRIVLREQFVSDLAVDTAEEVDFGGDADAAAEVEKRTQLVHGVLNHATHRTRPVEEDHDAVVLLIVLDRDALKDVLAELVLGEVAGRDASRLGTRLTRIVTRSTTSIEPLDHEIDRAAVLLRHLLESLKSKAVHVLAHATRSKDIVADAVAVVATDLALVHESNELVRGHDNLGSIDLRDGDRLFDGVGVDELGHRLLKVAHGRGSIGSEVGILLGFGFHVATLIGLVGRVGGRAVIVRVFRAVGLGTARLLFTFAIFLRLAATALVFVAAFASLRLVAVAVLFAVGTGGFLALFLATVRGFALATLAILALLTLTALVAVVALLLLAFLLLLLRELIEIGRDVGDILEGLGRVDAVDEDLLLSGERDHHARVDTQLVVEVDAVNEGKRSDIATLKTEGIHRSEFLVPRDEVRAKARELALDHALNTRILDHIDVVLRDHAVALATDADALALPLISGSVLGMADFVTDKEVIDRLVLVLPLREDKPTRVEFEPCRLGIGTMLDRDALRREELRQERVAGGVRGVHSAVSHAVSIR